MAKAHGLGNVMVLALAALVGCGGGSTSPVCGDGVCEGDETATSCPADCSVPFCGDGLCNGSETNATCPGDCPANPVCGDGVCAGGETAASCPVDCVSGPVCGDGLCNGTESHASCGDATCNGTETCSSCQGDCGPCCTTSPDTCTGENICMAGQCVSAFGRNYQIVVVDGTMTQFNASGTTWDAAGGLPDPFVVVTLNGTGLAMTTTMSDTLTPLWNQSTMVVIPAGSSFNIDVWDEDLTVNDYMFGCVSNPLTADVLRLRNVHCDGVGALSAATVNFTFTPL